MLGSFFECVGKMRPVVLKGSAAAESDNSRSERANMRPVAVREVICRFPAR